VQWPERGLSDSSEHVARRGIDNAALEHVGDSCLDLASLALERGVGVNLRREPRRVKDAALGAQRDRDPGLSEPRECSRNDPLGRCRTGDRIIIVRTIIVAAPAPTATRGGGSSRPFAARAVHVIVPIIIAIVVFAAVNRRFAYVTRPGLAEVFNRPAVCVIVAAVVCPTAARRGPPFRSDLQGVLTTKCASLVAQLAAKAGIGDHPRRRHRAARCRMPAKITNLLLLLMLLVVVF
jgi:hypothetical protein